MQPSVSDPVDTNELRVRFGQFDVVCPGCRRRLLELRFREGHDGALLNESVISPDREEGDGWRLFVPGDAPVTVRWVREVLDAQVVRARGVDVDLLAEPCLLRAAEVVRQGLSIATHAEALTLVTCLVAHVLRSSGDGEICSHGVIIDGHLCTTLVLTPLEQTQGYSVGLLSVPEVFPISPPKLPPGLLPVDMKFLEAAPDEPVLGVEDLESMQTWETVTCQRPRQNRRWQHLILVSHRWPTADCPGTTEDLIAVKRLVNTYVDAKLEDLKSSSNDRIKATRREDFGVWIDYMMVPNDLRHGGRGNDCPACLRLKEEAIKRINALLTLATVLSHSPDEDRRGWILQELSLNAHRDPHARTKVGHRDRVRLMQQSVAFTDPVDGARLRCYEFVRLGQMPRVWPAVNLELLARWQQDGQSEEGSAAAWKTLTEYARSFDKDCHRLKRIMAELSQAVALAGADCVIDLTALVDAVDEQGGAMLALQRRIALDDRPGAPTDPDQLLSGRMAVEKRVDATRTLQLQQFVGVAMGLRAEWTRGAGLASWVRSTVLTDAVTGTKFMARLKGGRVRASEATSAVTIRDQPLKSSDRFQFALSVASDGVSADVLREAYRQ